MAEYYFIITCIHTDIYYNLYQREILWQSYYNLYSNDMAEYYLFYYDVCILKIWQSMTLLLLVSLRYGRVLRYYNWYP